MRIAEYQERLELRVRDAEQMNASAPVADVLRAVLRELSEIHASSHLGRMLNTRQVAEILGVKPKTIANWAAAGRFAGAKKTSGVKGNWSIPVEEVKRANERPRQKLWRRP